MKRKSVLRNPRFALVFILFIVFFSSFSLSQDWKGKGRLNGIVLDEKGHPVANAQVNLSLLALGAKFELTTDEKGEFKIAWIKGGLWNVIIVAPGYSPQRQTYRVSEIISNPPMEIVLKKSEGAAVQEERMSAVKTLLNEGDEFYEQKNYKEALVKYKAILEEVPELSQINMNIGNCYYEMGEYDSAISYYQELLEKEPENQEAIASLGNVYLEMGELEKGMELLNKLSDQDVSNPLTLYNIATLLFNKGKAEAAVQYYEQVVGLDPEMADAYYQLGMCYLGANEKEKARENFLKYLELNPDSEKSEQVKTFLKYLEKNGKS